MTLPAVLVTDGQLRPSLAVARSLGRAGYRVYVCSTRRRSLAGASRATVAEAQVPDPMTRPDAFADAVAGLIRQWGIDVLMPISEESLLALLPAADRMGVRLPFPSLEIFRRAADKEYVTAVAATLGIAVPEQVVVQGRRDIPAPNDGSLRFPLVVKPARSVAGDGSNRAKLGVAYADDRAELDQLVAALPDSAFPLLLQQRIDGPGIGVFLLIWNATLVAQFAHRRIREKPPSGGVSVLSESIDADPEAVRQSSALLTALDWRGPAMVEYKQDRRTGTLYLMEINGRFWGSLQLAVDAGVDFPALLVAAALDRQPEPVAKYDVGTRTRWWWGEVDHLIARLRPRGRLPGLREGAGAVRDFLLPGRGVRNEVLRLSDPWPFVRESLEWLRGR